MKIVIDIPKVVYEAIRDYKNPLCCKEDIEMTDAIKNGTPLPRGYGDLVDRDDINRRFNAIWNELESLSNKPSYKELLDKFSMCLDTAPTIIEADEEGADE